MSKNKYVITRLCNEKKPITYKQPLFKEKDGGMYMNFTESIITQMVKARDEDEFRAICERIQEFIEKEGIDVCFAINQNELLDCLNEHQKLKLQIEQLEHRLSNCIELPQELKVGGKIFWANEDGLYFGKVYAITKDLNYKADGFNIWIYCVYNNGLTFYHLIKDFGVELFATEEEAKAKLEDLKK